MTTTTDIIDFRTETDDGATLHGFREGHGRPLLLVSGLSGTAGFWADIAATLGRSFQIIRFDQRGIGGSSRGAAPCDIERLARDGLDVLDAAGLDRAVVLGHSTGGCIAQAMAKLAPGRLDGLILSGSWLKACCSARGAPSSAATRRPSRRSPSSAPTNRAGSRRTGTSTTTPSRPPRRASRPRP